MFKHIEEGFVDEVEGSIGIGDVDMDESEAKYGINVMGDIFVLVFR